MKPGIMTAVDNGETAVRGRGRPRDEFARERILDAALKELEESGFANATMEAIADRAGASKATVYRWWPNKAAVFIEAFRETIAPEIPFPETDCLANDIRKQLQNFARMLNGRGGRLLVAFVTAAQSDPEVAGALWSLWVGPRRKQAKEALERHRRRGELKADVDTDVALDIMYGPLYYRLMLGGGNLSLSQAYAEKLARVVIVALDVTGGTTGLPATRK
jgi:AcrR family transcriptional regulator